MTGKCDVRTAPPGTNDRGLVVRLAASAPGAALSIATQATITTVADSAVDVQLLAPVTGNLSRLKFSIFNDSTVTLYVAIGGQTASTTLYTVQILAGGYFESVNDIQCFMEVRGIWASDPNTGAARITTYSI
jgi:hypothetical protein